MIILNNIANNNNMTHTIVRMNITMTAKINCNKVGSCNSCPSISPTKKNKSPIF